LERREKVSVLGRVRCVDQQPSGEPEVGDEGGNQQSPGDKTIVSREEEVQARVHDVTDTGNPHGVTQVAREDTPHADGDTKHEHVNTAKDCEGGRRTR